MSTVSEEGVMAVKTEACDQLLAQRLEVKMKSKRVNEVVNRLHVATPTQRDNKARPPCIPPAVLERRKAAMEVEEATKKLAKDIEQEQGADYYMDLRQHWMVENPEEKEDVIPEIFLGKNIADYIDSDIMQVGMTDQWFDWAKVQGSALFSVNCNNLPRGLQTEWAIHNRCAVSPITDVHGVLLVTIINIFLYL